MMMNRRELMKAGLVGMTAYLLPSGTARSAIPNKTLVVLFQHGAADGLQMVIPRSDPLYYGLRPTIAIPAGAELDLDADFGLHPALAPLQPLFQSGDLAVIHAAGSPDPSRSHFDCQDWMQRGAPGNKTIVDGWINRYLASQGGGAPIEGITLDSRKAKSLLGVAPSVAFKSIGDFQLTGQRTAERGPVLSALYAPLESMIGGGVNEAFSALDIVASVDTATAVVYPNTDLGRQLKDAAALIKAEVGIRVINVPYGKWDHHSDIDTRMDLIGGGFAQALAAFHEDLGTYRSSTCTVAMTEFGRRPYENGSGGTDHGHGGVMWALGGGIAGGRVILKDDVWPGLGEQDLFNGQDLAVTTDFRNVIAEVLDRHMEMASPSDLFPNYSVVASDYPGLYA